MQNVLKKSRNGLFAHWRKAAPAILLILGWFWIGWFARGLFSPKEDAETALIKQAQTLITEKYFGDAPTSQEMTYAALRGMVSSIGDPYAAFYEPPLTTHNDSERLGDSAVIGVRGEMRDGSFAITEVTEGGPAAQAGVQTGDRVLQIDGWQVRPDSEYMEVMTMIRGPLGSSARLVVQRGDQTLSFDIPRQAVQEATTKTLEGKISYLRFDQFTEKTPEAVKKALQDLLANNPSALILDLRYNGGGSIDATQKVLDLFLNEGIAFYAQTKNGQLISFPTKSGDLAEEIPLIVLISPRTYSASETMAASIADRGRGILVGETTYGKGAIKETVYLPDGSSIQLTVAHWLSPVQKEYFGDRGVSPDFTIKEDPAFGQDLVLDYAVDLLRKTVSR